MDEQNNQSQPNPPAEVPTTPPFAPQPVEATPAAETQPSKQTLMNKKTILIGIAILIIVALGGSVFFLTSQNSSNTTDSGSETLGVTTVVTDSLELETLFNNLKKTYNGNIPWDNIKNKQAYQLYPKNFKDLSVGNNKITVQYNPDYSAVTQMPYGAGSIPLQNAYWGYYQGTSETDNQSIFPVELDVYEFNRSLTPEEIALIDTDELLKCINDSSTTTTSHFSDENISAGYCNVNLTDAQKPRLQDDTFKDVYYYYYFKQSNTLAVVSFNSSYIQDTNSYMTDLMTTLFSSDNSAAINLNQVSAIGAAQEFDEWRQSTYVK